MIQRIQSVYLLLVIALCTSVYFLPLSSKISITDTTLVYKMDAFNIYQIKAGEASIFSAVLFNSIINGVIGFLSLFAIFKFKNRGLQLKICKILLLISTAFFALLFYETDRMIPGTSNDFKTIYLPGIYAAVIIPILVFMALKAIKKDDDLVRSVDRIR